MGEHEASAVTGGGIEEQPCAVLGGGGISDPERAGRRALAWQPGAVDSGAFPGRAGRRVGRPARRHPGHLARAAGEVIASLVS
jgi:hypothetical protein